MRRVAYGQSWDARHVALASAYLGHVPSGTLPADTERSLARRAQRGDRVAQQNIIESVLPQIFSIADSAANSRVSIDDLVQEACIEALRVLKHRFDPNRNPYVHYWVYAQIFVRSAVRRATRRKGSRPLPQWPSWGYRVESHEDEILSYLALREIHWALTTAISTLDDRLQSIIYYSYGFFADPPPDSAIAAKYNISEERVRQLRASAIRQMRAKVAQPGVIGDRLREVARHPNAPQPSDEAVKLWRNARLKPGATAPPPLPRERALDDPLWW